MADLLSRRTVLATAAGAAAASWFQREAAADPAEPMDPPIAKKRIRQSVVLWCFQPVKLERFAAAAARLGFGSVELSPPESWPMLRKFGLTCAIAGSHGFVKGLNNPAHHEECLAKLKSSIEAASDAGVPNVITFSGMRGELTDEEGIANTITALKKIVPLAEKRKVTICLEPLNTRVAVEMKGHPGYQCDKVEWALEVCQAIDSPRMKILFDIYHTQIMQGDLITRIRALHPFIGHYHTAGVPGRQDLDDTQEINYPAVMREILETGYTGFVGQEFIPKAEDYAGKIAALAKAARLCDV